MLLARAFEEAVIELTAAGEIPGLVHVGIGQEAVAAGTCAHLRDDDYLWTGHRAHGHFLAKGADPARTMAELLGRETGLCRGRGGSMHLVDVTHGLLGASGIVGGTIPLALGTALATQERRDGRVTVVFFGDGAAQAGHFHESLNLASLWELPVLLVCENNGYAEFTPRAAHTRVERVTDLAGPYGIPSATLDGNDAVAVWEAAGPFVEQLRAGRGPALLECLTYRLKGHYVGDPSSYRSAAELADWRAKDPIHRFQAAAIDSGWLTDGEWEALGAETAEVVRAAVAAARSAPLPAAEDLHRFVYA